MLNRNRCFPFPTGCIYVFLMLLEMWALLMGLSGTKRRQTKACIISSDPYRCFFWTFLMSSNATLEKDRKVDDPINNVQKSIWSMLVVMDTLLFNLPSPKMAKCNDIIKIYLRVKWFNLLREVDNYGSEIPCQVSEKFSKEKLNVLKTILLTNYLAIGQNKM